MSRDALVVGINTYQCLPGLRAPAHDAEAIAHHLQTYGEFRVHRLPEVIQSGKPQIGAKTQVTLRELETALVQLFKPKGNTVPHTALFYFSGHGIQKEAGIQEGYLALSDSQPEVGFYGLSLFWLRRLLQESPVRQRIILLDCCHSGELLNFLEADPGARSGTDRLFMAASREYESAYESLESPYSVLTQALLSGLDPSRQESGIVTNHSLTAWVSQSLNGEIQQPLFESSGSEIILTRQTNHAAPVKLTPSLDVCPYRGLEFFDEAHAEYFFGREELTDQLIEKLRTGQFVAVVGASGSGKSSLVRAGLIWELRRGQKFSGSDRWRIKLLTPTEHPIRSLASAFIDPDLTELERAEQLRRAEAFLNDGGTGLAQLVRASLPPTAPGTTGLQPKARPHALLIIDQFEEVFTLCQGPQAERERRQFFTCLLGALEAAKDCLSVVIVLRADFFGKCSLYDHLAQQIEQNLVMVTPLNYEQIKATIIRPAQKVGLVCEPNLVYTMLLDVIGAPGELPLLQYTLLELWQRRQLNPENGTASLTLDTYTELGGVRGTLQKRATEIFYSLTVEEQAIAKRIFLALTQLGEGTEDTRRRVLKSELVSSAFPIDLVERALEKLVAAKLVVTNQDREGLAIGDSETRVGTSEFLMGDGLNDAQSAIASSNAVAQETIDVAHEALIRNWSLLRHWLDENRDMLQRQRRIERAAQEWDAANQSVSAEYLLRGNRLIDAEDFVSTFPHELSALGQQYVAVSQDENQRAKRESRLLQIAVPSVLLVALMMTFNQYRSAVQTQTEKDYQLRVVTSRERAAIAQSILQEPNSDPMAALLISRLAAEQGGPTYEAQSSLRAALHSLRLQLELRGHQGAVHQVAFSANQRYLATSSADGTIRLWSLDNQTIYTTQLEPIQVWSWNPPNAEAAKAEADITVLAISPEGEQVAAIAQGSAQVKVWSTETGDVTLTLKLPQPVNRVMFSPDGDRLITTSIDQTISVWNATTGRLLATVPRTGAINSIQLSPDGQLLLTAGADGIARIWGLAAGADTSFKPELVRTLQHSAALNSAAFSPSGRWIATGANNGQAHIWDAATGKLIRMFPKGLSAGVANSAAALPLEASQASSSTDVQPITQVLFSPNEQFLVATDINQHVWLWDVKSSQIGIKLITTHSSRSSRQELKAKPIAFSPDSRLIITADHHQVTQNGSYAARLWNVQTGQEVGTLQGHQGVIEAVQFSPDGAYVATSSADGLVRLWSAERGGELPTVAIPNTPVRWASFVNQQHDRPVASTHLAGVGAPSQTSRVTNRLARGLPSPEKQQTENEASSPMALMRIVTVAANGTLQQWQIWANSGSAQAPSPHSSLSLSQHTGQIAFQNFWQWLLNIASRASRNLGHSSSTHRPNPAAQQINSHLHTAPTSQPLNQEAIALTTASLTGFALSQDGQFMAVATADGWVEIRQMRPNRSPHVLHRFQNTSTSNADSTNTQPKNSISLVRLLTFSPDSKQLMGISDDQTIRLWTVQTGHLAQILRGHHATIEDAQFSADGQWIVTASGDQTARIWRTNSGRTVQVIVHRDSVSSASFSPDSQLVVTTSRDGNVRISSVESGETQVILTGHRENVLSAKFSPDGHAIITAGEDGTARLWNAETGVEEAQLRPMSLSNTPALIRQAFFSPDGQYIATLTDDGQVQLWAATWEMLLKLARDRSLRQLTLEECIRYLRVESDECPSLSLNNTP